MTREIRKRKGLQRTHMYCCTRSTYVCCVQTNRETLRLGSESFYLEDLAVR